LKNLKKSLPIWGILADLGFADFGTRTVAQTEKEHTVLTPTTAVFGSRKNGPYRINGLYGSAPYGIKDCNDFSPKMLN